MSHEKTIYIDQDGGFGEPSTAVIIANFAAQIIPSIFGGGKQDAKRRDAKRAALAQIGFNWLQTSGVPAGQEWNIDNWPDISLDNIANAVARHGQIVVDLHNQQKFNPDNTATMQQIESVITSNGGALNQGPSGSSWNQGFFSNQGSNQASSAMGGINFWPMALLGVAGLGLVVSMRNSRPVQGSVKSTKGK